MTETWTPLKEFYGYDISSEGRVRSWKNNAGGKRSKPFLMKPTLNKDGYWIISFGVFGKRVQKTLHQLILETVKGPRPVGSVVRHLNGNKLDNRIENLTWGTPGDNNRDTSKHGKSTRGSRSWNAVFTEKLVKKLKVKLAAGASLTALATELGVSKQALSHIKAGRTWKHV